MRQASVARRTIPFREAAVPETLGDLVKQLGVPAARIRLRPPPGTARVQDVVTAMEAPRKRLCELVDGTLVEKPMGALESMFAVKIGGHMDRHAERHDLGVVLGESGALRLLPTLVRIPDVSFISWDRIPGQEFPTAPVPTLIPDLAVEVISESNTPKEMARKLREYFDVGVRLAWLIYPKTQTAEVYTSPTAVRRIPKNGVLDGGNLLPGFRLPLKSLFARAKRRAKRR